MQVQKELLIGFHYSLNVWINNCNILSILLCVVVTRKKKENMCDTRFFKISGYNTHE